MQQTEMMEGVERQGQKGKRRKKENSPKQYLPSYEKQQQLECQKCQDARKQQGDAFKSEKLFSTQSFILNPFMESEPEQEIQTCNK